jgi:hypothetical protein
MTLMGVNVEYIWPSWNTCWYPSLALHCQIEFQILWNKSAQHFECTPTTFEQDNFYVWNTAEIDTPIFHLFSFFLYEINKVKDKKVTDEWEDDDVQGRRWRNISMKRIVISLYFIWFHSTISCSIS